MVKRITSQKTALSKDSVSCPQERRKVNRREKLSKTYDSKEWDDARNEFTGHREFTIRGIVRSTLPDVGEAGWFLQEVMWWFERKKPCEWHLKTQHPVEVKVSTLPHHPYIESYADGTYKDLYLSGCVVLCNSCHYACHHGLVLCKRCGAGYHGVGADMCKSCWLGFHPEMVEARKKKKEDMNALKKKMRDDSKVRECNSTLQERLDEKCRTLIPTKYHCKECPHLGEYVKKKRVKKASEKYPSGSSPR
jgi:hypothetical protein